MEYTLGKDEQSRLSWLMQSRMERAVLALCLNPNAASKANCRCHGSAVGKYQGGVFESRSMLGAHLHSRSGQSAAKISIACGSTKLLDVLVRIHPLSGVWQTAPWEPSTSARVVSVPNWSRKPQNLSYLRYGLFVVANRSQHHLQKLGASWNRQSGWPQKGR